MEQDQSIHVFIFIAFFFLLSDSAPLDTISANQEIKDGNTIVSKGEMFELGFFSPGKSKNRYLGIWYNKISTGTVVWVANRETPITDSSGMFKLSSDGALLIYSSHNSNTIIWSSNSTTSSKNTNPTAQILDNGNLVVLDHETSNNSSAIWESFDYPGNTLLAGMKLGKDLVTGKERYITSWKSPEDPAPGVYNSWINTNNGYPQLCGRRGEVILWRLGPWNGLGFSGYPTGIPNPVYDVEFVVNEKEIYFRCELKGSVVQISVVTTDGKTQQLGWSERVKEWVVYADMATDGCDRYGLCGPYGICHINRHPPCGCMEGFEPRFVDEWAADWSGGCKHKEGLDCEGGGDWFRKVGGVKLPDTQSSWYNRSMSLGECEVVCKRNCSCTAYANLDVRKGGSGCLLWFGQLMDIRQYDDGEDLYIRMAASELAGHMVSQTGFERTRLLTVVMSISSFGLLLSIVAYSYRHKRKRSHKKEPGNWTHALDKNHTSVEMETLDELPFFSLDKIAKATDNFSVECMLGEGGFGPVYKGVLEDGQEIAAKRLSKTSQQGLDEFKTEVICIAKLQHRNLVKLLGYCIHGNEKILIYEYMANKSLDTFLFDETRRSMLDWPQRFHIINGIARGILYLHQDSRLQIIHRDLKAGNILLDNDMNPKVSDFGLARKFVGYDTTAMTKKVVGTYGYISPEYAVHGRFSVKSDVFSFGVLVLEIVSGKKNRGFSHENHSDSLLGHAWRLYKEDRSIELMDKSLRDSCVVSEVLRSIHVGLLCVQHNAEDRPTMLSVVLMLVSESALPHPRQPAFFTGEAYRELESISSVDDYMITQVYCR